MGFLKFKSPILQKKKYRIYYICVWVKKDDLPLKEGIRLFDNKIENNF